MSGRSSIVKAIMERAGYGEAPIKGLPQKQLIVGGQPFTPGPSRDLRDIAQSYMSEKGLPYTPLENYVPVNERRAKSIAEAYESMKHTPDDLATQRAYDALARETRDQYEALHKMGVKFQPLPAGVADPYAATPRLAVKDLLENKHMYYFPTEQGFGSGHLTEDVLRENPMLRPSGVKIEGKEVPFNDLFRVVHDAFGHAKEGVGFRAAGEENAWRGHSRMFSPEALPAITAETRGQNSWVNYGPQAQQNLGASAADTVYAPQKVGTLPDWVMQSGRMTPLAIGGGVVAAPEIMSEYAKQDEYR